MYLLGFCSPVYIRVTRRKQKFCYQSNENGGDLVKCKARSLLLKHQMVIDFLRFKEKLKSFFSLPPPQKKKFEISNNVFTSWHRRIEKFQGKSYQVFLLLRKCEDIAQDRWGGKGGSKALYSEQAITREMAEKLGADCNCTKEQK